MADILKQVPTPHNGAKVGDIAKTVLMPGDPLRAKFIAETFLDNPVCFNQVRGMLGYTGTYKGIQVSVMGSGMGMPSMGIYSYELFDLYGVENIIRIGSCGAHVPELNVFDLVLVTEAHTESSYLKAMMDSDEKVLYPTPELNDKIVETAKNLDILMVAAPILSGDCFYNSRNDYYKTEHAKTGALASEMESFALFANARALNKKAACILTVSDNMATRAEIPAEEREKAFTNMMEIALHTAIAL